MKDEIAEDYSSWVARTIMYALKAYSNHDINKEIKLQEWTKNTLFVEENEKDLTIKVANNHSIKVSRQCTILPCMTLTSKNLLNSFHGHGQIS